MLVFKNDINQNNITTRKTSNLLRKFPEKKKVGSTDHFMKNQHKENPNLYITDRILPISKIRWKFPTLFPTKINNFFFEKNVSFLEIVSDIFDHFSNQSN